MTAAVRAIAHLAGALSLTAAAAAPVPLDTQPPAPARDYARRQLAPFFGQHRPLHRALREANRRRRDWPAYSEAWRSWSRADAAAATDGFTFRQYRWAVRADEAMRTGAREGPVADRLRALADGSGGAVIAITIVGARGGTVVQTRTTDDWYRADEPIAREAATQRRVYVGAVRPDEHTGRPVRDVGVPVVGPDDRSRILGVAIVTVDPAALR